MTHSTSVTYLANPGGTPRGTLRVPGDKSISHRAVMLAALADGISEVRGFLTGEDCLATMKAFQAMGVRIEKVADTGLRIHGVGLKGLQAPQAALDLGNSGTSMRLMSGLLAGQAFAATLTGDVSLSKRPMRRIVEPLRLMGATIATSQTGTAPLHLEPVRRLEAIRYHSPVASAQVKSGILLAGLYAEGLTTVQEPHPTRDHTERMLRAFGVEVDAAPGHAALRGGQRLRATTLEVPSDISSATFFLVAAAIVPGSDVTLTGVGINPTRDGIVHILRKMGVTIELVNERQFGGEPVADLRVQGPARLQGTALGGALVANAIDELPAVFIAAACAEGETVVSDAAELRVKESDRIAAMVDGLKVLGVDAEARPDGARIAGVGAVGRLGGGAGGLLCGGTVDSLGDHRIAMSFAVAALRAAAPITIRDCANVDTSFPGFVELAQSAGLRLERQ